MCPSGVTCLHVDCCFSDLAGPRWLNELGGCRTQWLNELGSCRARVAQ
jgi:hypothetical protein